MAHSVLPPSTGKDPGLGREVRELYSERRRRTLQVPEDERTLRKFERERQRELEQERMLREELRALQFIIVRVMTWGVTVLVSVQTALFFVRRDVAHAEATNSVTLEIPLNRYLLGTFFLTLLATIIFRLWLYVSTRLRHYRKQLENCPSGIIELPVRNGSRPWVALIFYIFPMVDILARIYLRIGLK